MNELNELNQRVFDAAQACLDEHQEGPSWVTNEDVHDKLADPSISEAEVRQSLVELASSHLNVVPRRVDGILTRVDVQSVHMP